MYLRSPQLLIYYLKFNHFLNITIIKDPFIYMMRSKGNFINGVTTRLGVSPTLVNIMEEHGFISEKYYFY